MSPDTIYGRAYDSPGIMKVGITMTFWSPRRAIDACRSMHVSQHSSHAFSKVHRKHACRVSLLRQDICPSAVHPLSLPARHYGRHKLSRRTISVIRAENEDTQQPAEQV